MKIARFVVPFVCFFCFSLFALSDDGGEMKRYADDYVKCEDAHSRLRLANDFFTFLRRIDYIDEPIVFPSDSHIDSVDVNVYYYVAEWYYGEGEFQSAVDYCTRAEHSCTDKVDDVSKSDVYSLLGAALFRLGVFDKASDALNKSYELDKKSGDFDRMSSTLNNIASVFTAAGKPEEAEKYILEAIAANSLTENLTRRAVLYGTTSEIYKSIGDMEQSLEYARKALDTERQIGDSARIGVRLSQLANAQMGLSKFDEARLSLEEAIPLLQRSGNLHSWGICQNQMGDILASEDKKEEAAACYLEAAMLFLGQGDKYNELHAREGLYQMIKSSSPNEAMMHLERAKLLQDSIYRNETSEATSRYNAIYYNDILKKEKERAELWNRIVMVTVALLLVVILVAIVLTYRRHKKKIRTYEASINSLQDQSAQLSRQYQNVVAEALPESPGMTDDDREFVSLLTNVIYEESEKGITDLDSIAERMHISVLTLRRRLAKTLSVTPKAFILRIRMQKAKYLLQNYRDITISEVAERCGYSQMANFTRAFTRFYGMMPSDARQ